MSRGSGSRSLVPAGLEASTRDALLRASAQTLPDLYDAWRSFLLSRASAAADRARARQALEVRAEIVLKSVQNARELAAASPPAPAPEPSGPGAKGKRGRAGGRKPKQAQAQGQAALAPADALSGYLDEAQKEIAAARRLLEERAVEEERFFEREIEKVKRRIKTQVEALLAHHRPRIEAQVQPVGQDRSIVHLDRPQPQDLLLFAYVLCGKLFTRYEGFLDDSVDQVGQEPPRFYAEEGLDKVRFERPEEEEAFVDDPGRVFLPLKGMIPVKVPGRAFPRFRLLNRGPLMEAQARAEGGDWEHLMPRQSAELLTGLLIKLKVEGRIELSLKVA